jgi:hypothetical protein
LNHVRTSNPGLVYGEYAIGYTWQIGRKEGRFQTRTTMMIWTSRVNPSAVPTNHQRAHRDPIRNMTSTMRYKMERVTKTAKHKQEPVAFTRILPQMRMMEIS